MLYNDEWKDFCVISTSQGMKLEKWGSYILLRPDPQVIWEDKNKLENYPNIDAIYHREGGGGKWQYNKPLPTEWIVGWRNLKFKVKPMGFKHTGLFPEQAVNWDKMINVITNANRPIKVLNLFAYTGGATVACASAGAEVTHVDSAKNMVERAKENIALSGLSDKVVRYIVDDCKKFVQREIKRGKKYDAIIMDPPSYGRGPNGEMWKIEADIFPLVELCAQLLSDQPLFFLINSYTTGLQPTVMSNILKMVLKGNFNVEAYEVGLKVTNQEGVYLPCGCSAFAYYKQKNK